MSQNRTDRNPKFIIINTQNLKIFQNVEFNPEPIRIISRHKLTFLLFLRHLKKTRPGFSGVVLDRLTTLSTLQMGHSTSGRRLPFSEKHPEDWVVAAMDLVGRRRKSTRGEEGSESKNKRERGK